MIKNDIDTIVVNIPILMRCAAQDIHSRRKTTANPEEKRVQNDYS